MPSPPSARQAGHTPQPGALYADDIVAKNAQRLRVERGWTQGDVAVRMQALNHATWTQAIVSRFERLLRPVGLSELFALAMVFEVSHVQLLDVRGAGAEALDLAGPGEIGSEPADHWIKGRRAPHLEWNGEGYVPGSTKWAWLPQDEWTCKREARIRQRAEKGSAK